MNTILNIVIIALLVLLAAGLASLYVYQKRSRAISRVLHAQQVKHIWATVALHNSILDSAFPLPASGGWSLSSELLAYLVRKILHDKPKLVVELGSGLSTVVLGNALKRVGGRLISVEAELPYLQETETMIRDAGLTDQVKLIHAPLEQYDAHHIWYSKSTLNELRFIDILLVDGPPATTCRLARYPALPFFLPKLNSGATIILDDTERADEQEVIDRWKNELAITAVTVLPFPHVPAVLHLPHAETNDNNSDLWK